MPEFRFVRWLDPDETIAVVEVVDTRQAMYVPLLRLIPHPLCTWQYSLPPGEAMRRCAETGSWFGIELFRWWMHRAKNGRLAVVDDELLDEAVEPPPRVDFGCLRDCVIAGGHTIECYARCSGW